MAAQNSLSLREQQAQSFKTFPLTYSLRVGAQGRGSVPLKSHSLATGVLRGGDNHQGS